jgi:hypothetical protein
MNPKPKMFYKRQEIPALEKVTTTQAGGEKKMNKLNFVMLVIIILFLISTLITSLLVKNKWEEITFAYEHPQIVKAVKEVYINEHRKAEDNILLRQRSDIKTETEVPEQIKK